MTSQSDQATHQYLYWEFPAYGYQQAVRLGSWKAVRHGVDRGNPPFELYDLAADIGETRNVSADHPDIIERVEKIADEAHTKSNLFPVLAEDMPRRKDRPRRRPR